jgi:hypothetical protein
MINVTKKVNNDNNLNMNEVSNWILEECVQCYGFQLTKQQVRA